VNAARYGAVVAGAGPAGEVAATKTPISVLRHTGVRFPTFSEAYLKGVESLEL